MTSLLLAAVLFSTVTYEGDVVTIESDESQHGTSARHSEWSGNVILTSDGYVLSSELLVAVYNDQDQIVNLIATGVPVKVKGSGKNELVVIEGRTIVYDVTDQIAQSTGDAHYDDGTMKIDAESVLYRFVQR